MSGRICHVHDNIPGASYIGRANGSARLRASPLANPFRIGVDGDRVEVIRLYRGWLASVLAAGDRPDVVEALIGCRGRDLSCWCRHDGEPKTAANACHGDVIVDTLERYTDEELRAMGGRR